MCIRDSHFDVGVQDDLAVLGQSAAKVRAFFASQCGGVRGAVIAGGLLRGCRGRAAVSYTHLDVYKRQALTVKLAAFTASAKEKIEKAGGKAEVI